MYVANVVWYNNHKCQRCRLLPIYFRVVLQQFSFSANTHKTINTINAAFSWLFLGHWTDIYKPLSLLENLLHSSANRTPCSPNRSTACYTRPAIMADHRGYGNKLITNRQTDIITYQIRYQMHSKATPYQSINPSTGKIFPAMWSHNHLDV